METKSIRNEKGYLEIVFVLLCFTLYFTWSLMQPYDTGPDEYMRYDIPKFIFQHGELPLGQDPSIRNPIWGISYGFGPLLPAIISSIIMKLVSLFTMDELALLMGARMVSILASTGTVFVSIKISKHIFTKQAAWLFVALVSLLPQFVFISTYVNNDAVAIFSTALIVYFWILGQKVHWNIKSCIGLAIALSIGAMSYTNVYGFILMSIILFFWSYLKFDETDKFKNILKKAALITIIASLLAGWWFVRNYMLYGDFFGNTVSLQYSELYAIDKFKPSNRETPFNLGYTVKYMIFNMGWLKDSYYSFIGRFGYMSILLSNWMYWIYNIIFSVGLIGLIVKLVNIKGKKELIQNTQKIIFYVCISSSIVIPIILSAYFSYKIGYQPQGRYLLPTLLPLMTFVVKGIEEISGFFHKFKYNFLYIIILVVLVISLSSAFIIIPQVYLTN